MSNPSPSGSSGSTNRTIDDEQGDSITGAMPAYAGSPWNYGPECTGCGVKLDASRAHDNSWHDTTVSSATPASGMPTVTLTFTGTAIYAFGILPNITGTPTNVTFALDGKQASTFFYDNPGDILYNVNMFSQTGLTNAQHTLEIAPQVGKDSSYLAFDYAIYTFEDAASTTSEPLVSASSSIPPGPASVKSRSVPIGAIVGGVITAAVIAALVLLFLLRRHRRAAAYRIRSNGERGDGIDEVAIKVEPFQPSVTNAGADFPDLTASEPLLSTTGEHPPMSEWSAGHLYRISVHGSQPSLTASTAAGASAFESPSDRAPGSSTNGDITHSDGSPHPSHIFGSATRSSAVSAIGRNPAPRPGTKAAMRQEELSRRLQEMEQHVADLNAQRAGLSAALSSPIGASSRSGGSSSGANEEALRTQVEALQAEVERLRTGQQQGQQQQAVWEVGTEPPPAYEGGREAGPVPNHGRAKETLIPEHGEAEQHPDLGEAEDAS